MPTEAQLEGARTSLIADRFALFQRDTSPAGTLRVEPRRAPHSGNGILWAADKGAAQEVGKLLVHPPLDFKVILCQYLEVFCNAGGGGWKSR